MLQRRPELVNMDMGGDEHRAIHFAVVARSPEMTRLLMRHGADARKGVYPHRKATCALTLAIEHEYDDIVAIIREEEARRPIVSTSADVATQPSADHATGFGGGRVDVDCSVLQNRPDEVSRLLDLGLDPNERERVGHGRDRFLGAGGPLYLCVATPQNRRAAAAGRAPRACSRPASDISRIQRRHGSELLESHGGRLDAISAGFARQNEAARQLLADEDAGRPARTRSRQVVRSPRISCGPRPAAGREIGGDGSCPDLAGRARRTRWGGSLWQAFTCHSGIDRGLACFRSVHRADPNATDGGPNRLHTRAWRKVGPSTCHSPRCCSIAGRGRIFAMICWKALRLVGHVAGAKRTS